MYLFHIYAIVCNFLWAVLFLYCLEFLKKGPYEHSDIYNVIRVMSVLVIVARLFAEKVNKNERKNKAEIIMCPTVRFTISYSENRFFHANVELT